MFSHASMNRSYVLVWNDKQQAYVPAPETARSRGKRSTTVIAAALAGLFASGGALAVDPGSLPSGGQVVAGQATITQSSNAMTIRQATAKAVIDWQSFNIGRDASVVFAQPSANAIALNRVVGQDATQILGRMGANGQVFIINPNGVLFGAGAQVSAAGVLASTRNISNVDFMAGNMTFSGSDVSTVENQGAIDVGRGGYVALIGAQVINSGAITAPMGDVRLAAAEQVSLKIDGSGLTAFSVDRGALDALAANHGLIKADGGRIYLTADALNQIARAVVNNTGVIEALTVENRNGTIVLKGDMQHGTVEFGGTLNAAAPDGGDGGVIETSAASVKIALAQTVNARAAHGKTGTWLIDPTDFTVAASGGDITGTQLTTALGSADVQIQSTSGAGGTAGNINVNDVVNWSANKLTLTARNNVNINANLNGTGSAQLALEFGQGAVAFGNTAAYQLADGVKVSLPAGNNLSLKKGSDGVATPYYVIDALGADGSLTGTDLQGLRAALGSNIALGADIDASSTSSWQSGAGFASIGSNGNEFTGHFEGLGNTITGLTLTSIGYAGLIGQLGSAGRVSNLNLAGVSVQGANSYTGGMVGRNLGTIDHVAVQGNVAGDAYVGGVTGDNAGIVRNAHVDAAVSALTYYVGGVVGNSTGSVTDSSSMGTVSGDNNVGGVIGWSQAPVARLHSSATVTGNSEVGGLIGRAEETVADSHASGSVTSPGGLVGGLIGHALKGVSNSYATGVVSGDNNVGGLIGEAENDVSGSYASGAVSATTTAGGLIGVLDGANAALMVSASHATGAVTTQFGRAGGLIGSYENGSVETSYATGNVDGGNGNNVGGLIGSWGGDTQHVSSSYASGNVVGAGQVGGLIGSIGEDCDCAILNSHASGTVTGSGSFVGGLLGYAVSGSVANSYATGDVTGDYNVGGLAGEAFDVTDSHATGVVQGTGNIGGLVGQEKMGGTISNSYANGNTTGVSNTGGLVGENWGTVTGASYSTSIVVGTDTTGGLVGSNHGNIDNAHTGNGGVAGPVVTGGDNTGGLVGYNFGDISNAEATGAVSASGSSTGGLVGFNYRYSTIADSTASGGVAGVNSVGGLIGQNRGNLDNSTYTSGTVTGTDEVGGLVGRNLSAGVIFGNASSTQAVTGTGNAVGGMVGYNLGTIGSGAQSSAVVQGVDQVGGLVGVNLGIITNGSTSGGSATGSNQVGGLVGSQLGGTISASTAAIAVSGNDAVGGFAGDVGNGAILTSNNTSGNVTAVSKAGGFVGTNAAALSGNASNGNHTTSLISVSAGPAGGFAGANSGTISDVTSLNAVTVSAGSTQDIGGIIGINTGTLQASHAANTVSAALSNNVGGAVGRNAAGGIVTTTYATNAVTGQNGVGGLVGNNAGTVNIDYSTGTVQGTNNVGGLVGQQSGTTDNAYSMSSVTGSDHVGGLLGYAGGIVAHTYASGAVSGSGANVGALVGSTNGATIGTSYFNLDTTGQLHSAGDYGSTGEVAAGKTAAQMRSAATFASWNLSTTGSHDKVWRSYDNLASPLLTYWLTPMTITANGPLTSYVYNGVGHTDAVTSVSFTETLAPGHLSGSAAYATGKNVGVYTLLGGHYSDQQGYDIGYINNGSITITPAMLNAAMASASKVYDGSTVAANPGAITLTGFITGEAASASAVSAAFNSKNVASATSITATLGYTPASGTLMSNYTAPASVTGLGSITQKSVTASASAADKIYDGSRSATVALQTGGFVAGDDASLSGVGSFADKNAGAAKSVSVSGVAIGGADSGNYALETPTLQTSASIARKSVAVSAKATGKVYDGSTAATVTLSASGVVAGDVLGLNGNAAFADKNAGAERRVDVTGITATGQDAGNYAVATATTGSAAITARPLTAALLGEVSKTFDGNANAVLGGANYVVGNVVAGESVTLNHAGGSYDSAAAGTGKNVSATVGAADYSAGAGTSLANYALYAGAVSGRIGTVVAAPVVEVLAPAASSKLDGVLASLPTSMTVSQADTGAVATVTTGGMARVSAEDGAVADPFAPARPSAVSSNTREDLSMRRAFSIGDGGMRLPRGVRGSDKDAEQ